MKKESRFYNAVDIFAQTQNEGTQAGARGNAERPKHEPKTASSAECPSADPLPELRGRAQTLPGDS